MLIIPGFFNMNLSKHKISAILITLLVLFTLFEPSRLSFTREKDQQAEYLDGTKTHTIEQSELLQGDTFEEYDSEMLHIDATIDNKF